MDSIDLLLGVVSVSELTDRVARITVSPWTWLRLNASVTERWILIDGFDLDETAEPYSSVLTITIDREQLTDFRLWDRDGCEVLFDWAKVYDGTWCAC